MAAGKLGDTIIRNVAGTGNTHLFAYLITFRIMGKDYEAVVMTSGHCGFGMGATPNAMANMGALFEKYGFAPKVFFILPLVGSLFIDFANASVITFFMNVIR